MKTIGKIIRAKREKLGLSRIELAGRIKVTPGYLGHLERDDLVHLSEHLEKKIEKVLKVIINETIVDKHNEKAREWYRDYRAKRAA